MRCTFCATGKGGFARNLRAHEIIDQVLTVQERFGTRVSNVGALPLLEKRFSAELLDAPCPQWIPKDPHTARAVTRAYIQESYKGRTATR